MNMKLMRPRFSRKFIDSYPIQSKLAFMGGVFENFTSKNSYGFFVLKLTSLFKLYMKAIEICGKFTLFRGM